MKYKVSVIIPVYNVEKYIEECLKSVLNQTLKEIEIIIINDATPDKSMDIVNEYELRYENIKIINKQNNEGVSIARNDGISLSNSEGIIFLDSDDILNKYAIEKMYQCLIEEQVDIVCANIKEFKSHKDVSCARKLEGAKKIIDKEQAIKYFFDRKNISAYACGKMYKSKLFKDRGIRFPKGMFYEDAPTTFELITYVNKICLIEDEVYFYRKGHISITKNISRKAVEDFNTAGIIIEKIYRKNKMEYKIEFENYIGIRAINNLILLEKCKLCSREKKELNELKKKLIKKVKRISFKELIKLNNNKQVLLYILVRLNILQSILKLKNINRNNLNRR